MSAGSRSAGGRRNAILPRPIFSCFTRSSFLFPSSSDAACHAGYSKHNFLICHFAENATKEIQKQDVDRKKSNTRILEDLNKIRNKAEEVWNKIGEWPFLVL